MVWQLRFYVVLFVVLCFLTWERLSLSLYWPSALFIGRLLGKIELVYLLAIYLSTFCGFMFYVLPLGATVILARDTHWRYFHCFLVDIK